MTPDVPTEPTRVGPQGGPDDGELRPPDADAPGAGAEDETAEADEAIEVEEGVGMTTEEIRKAGLVIDLPMEAASADPKPLRYDDD